MIYFVNKNGERLKYLINFDTEELNALAKKVALNCGELRLVRKECALKYVPSGRFFHRDYDDNTNHYYDDIRYSKSGNKTTEWDHYDEYEVDLYNCEYKDYLCPELVDFINRIMYEDKKTIDIVFNGDFRSVSKFPTVKEKIAQLQKELASNSESYVLKRQNRVNDFSDRYTEMKNKQQGDLEKQIKELHSFATKAEKELLKIDKNYSAKAKELKDKLDYLLSIEKLNEHQEGVAKYLEELKSLIEIKLIDRMSLDEIQRVKDFQSTEEPEEEEKGKQLTKKI